MCPEGFRCFLARPRAEISFASRGLVASLCSLLGSRLIDVSVVAAIVLDAFTTLSVDVLRTSSTNGSFSTGSNWNDSTFELPASNACGDCPLCVGKGGLTTTSIEVVEGTVEGTVIISGLPAFGVCDSIPKDFGNITFRVPADNRFSRSPCNCYGKGSVRATPAPSCKDCSNTGTTRI